MNPLRIPVFAARGILQETVERVAATVVTIAEAVELAMVATKPRRP